MGAKKSSTATFSHHLTFHIIWFDIMEPVALSSVQCLFQFEIHCLPDFTLICKCHLSRSRGNNLQWCKGKIYKKRRRKYERRRLNSKNHACLVILAFRRIGKLYLWVEEYFLLEEMHCDPVKKKDFSCFLRKRKMLISFYISNMFFILSTYFISYCLQ